MNEKSNDTIENIESTRRHISDENLNAYTSDDRSLQYSESNGMPSIDDKELSIREKPKFNVTKLESKNELIEMKG
jgi:hypothetical protein